MNSQTPIKCSLYGIYGSMGTGKDPVHNKIQQQQFVIMVFALALLSFPPKRCHRPVSMK